MNSNQDVESAKLVQKVYEYQCLQFKSSLSPSQRERLDELRRFWMAEQLERQIVGPKASAIKKPLEAVICDSEGFSNAVVHHVSGNGVALVSEAILDEGEKTMLRFEINGQSYSFTAEVVWTRGHIIGLVFEGAPTKCVSARTPHIATLRSRKQSGIHSWAPLHAPLSA